MYSDESTRTWKPENARPSRASIKEGVKAVPRYEICS